MRISDWSSDVCSSDLHRGSFAIEHRDGIPLPSPWICTNISFKDELNGELGMAEAYIVEAVRTAGGKRGGRLAGWHPADMAGAVLDSVVARPGIDPAAIEDVIMGCVSQGGEQSFQVGRGAGLASSAEGSVGKGGGRRGK